MNLLLAEAFAGILDAECVAIWRTPEGVPDVQTLEEIAHEPGGAQRYVAMKADDGRRSASRTPRRVSPSTPAPPISRRCTSGTGTFAPRSSMRSSTTPGS
ncbi:hypothetical protein [Streptomyces sp. LN245]|uniref:hypothetical protein n=1 Tax=Streptomyces sp. LN245 TaxID=3112975 RepID=UPI00371C696C